MTPGPTTDLGQRIERDLELGTPRDEVIQRLVDGGLSRATAERFVDRALAARARPAGTRRGARASAAPTEGGEGWGSLVGGTFWLSLGCCATLVTFLVADPGEKFVVAYGAVVAGLVLFLRGLFRWRASSSPFPGLAVAAAAALPLVGSVAILGYVARRERPTPEVGERAEEEQAAPVERHQETEEERAARREAARAARLEQRAERVQRALDRLRTNPRATTVCEAALQLGRAGAHEAIPDLENLLQQSDHASVRNCAAAALVDLGEVDVAQAFYVEGARSSDREVRRLALLGFGDLGPRGARVGLPYLQEALSSSDAVVRFAAVMALTKMGEAGEPLLRRALDDPSPNIRGFAARALGTERQD
jgi:hypothetical protein